MLLYNYLILKQPQNMSWRLLKELNNREKEQNCLRKITPQAITIHWMYPFRKTQNNACLM